MRHSCFTLRPEFVQWYFVMDFDVAFADWSVLLLKIKSAQLAFEDTRAFFLSFIHLPTGFKFLVESIQELARRASVFFFKRTVERFYQRTIR